MRDLNEVKGDKALDFWLDILEPITIIFSDEAVDEWRSGKRPGQVMISMLSEVVRRHRGEVWQVLAAFHGKSVNVVKKETSAIQMIQDLKEIFQMDGISDFFTSVVGVNTQTSSGLPTENTEDKEN